MILDDARAADPGRPTPASRLHTHLGHWLSLRPRVPIVLQTEAAECGLACIAMMLGFHGTVTDLTSLRRRHAISLAGLTLGNLVDIASRERLASRAIRLELDELRDLRTPCILHWDRCHFVVLESVSAKAAIVIDPARGRRVMPLAEVSRHFSGVALELWPEPDFSPRKDRARVSITQLAGRMTGWRTAAAQLLALSFALEFFTLLHPQLMQWLTDKVVLSRDVDLLPTLIAGMLVLVLLQQGMGLARSWLLTCLSASLRLQWRSNVFTHLLRLPTSYFQKRHLGDIVSRFDSVDAIQAAITSTALEIVLDGIMGGIALCLMVMYSPLMTAVALGMVLAYAMLRLVLHGPLIRAREEEIIRAASQSSHLLETIRGIRSIKLFTHETARRAHWQGLLTAELNAGLRLSTLRLVYGAGRATLSGGSEVAIIALGASAVLTDQMSLGMLLAFAAYRGQFHQRSTELIGKVFDLRLLKLDAQRLADIVLSPPEPRGQAVAPAGRPGPMDIEIKDLGFRYADHQPWVIDGLNLHIPQGQSVAIVGPSGSGKSTLLSLLLGEQLSAAGAILVDGVFLDHIDRSAWRRQVGAVLQDDTLFAGTLADNIGFFDNEPDPERLVTSARLAAVWEDIEAMPMGLNTLVGDMGTSLSGGQKQRILLARALYKRPRVLILDEATSALDLAKEQQVNAAIEGLGLTRIMVAHRLETIASTQRTVALERGKVVFDGPSHDYLARMRPQARAGGVVTG